MENRRFLERPGRTLTQLVDELIEEGKLFHADPAHQHLRCHRCKAVIYNNRTRNTFHGPWADTRELCGYCASDLANMAFDTYPDLESRERFQ